MAGIKKTNAERMGEEVRKTRRKSRRPRAPARREKTKMGKINTKDFGEKPPPRLAVPATEEVEEEEAAAAARHERREQRTAFEKGRISRGLPLIGVQVPAFFLPLVLSRIHMRTRAHTRTRE